MRRGFTVVELIAVVLIAVVIVAVLLPTGRRQTGGSRQLKDSTQVRGIQASMVVWANNNKSEYPLPSAFDLNDSTVSDAGRGKDTTANTMSMLIWNGHVSPELFISPAEANTGSIQRDEDYEYDRPSKASDPANALWDPAFSADFTNGNISNFSYAHLQPSGTRGTDSAEPMGRLLKWRDTFISDEAILGNRGPELSVAVTGPPDRESSYKVTVKNPNTNTFLIHGGRSSWEGNIAFNDGHVEFVTTLGPFAPGGGKTPTYGTGVGKRFDTIFFDEPDDGDAVNTFLGVFIKAGEKQGEFKAIWD